MKFQNAYIPLPLVWSSPFIRWQGAASDVNSIDLAIQVTKDALSARGVELERLTQLVYGTTILQKGGFYAAPYIAANIGMTHAGGPTISQACATSVACVMQAAASTELSGGEAQLVVTSDRTSNGPLIVYPRSNGMGGSPLTENLLLDAFAADPWTGESMVHTAENTARDGQFTREASDDLTLLRFSQYQRALEDDRRFQKQYMQPIVVRGRKQDLVLSEDAGISPYSKTGLEALKASLSGGIVTAGTQTHPADGAAGLVVMGKADATSVAKGAGVVRLHSVGFCRAQKGFMPKAPALAAARALASAGLTIKDVDLVVSHNPFAVNDLWFHKETGFPLEKMNPYGCSLIYGHPQGPTGMRGIAELIFALKESNGGIGLFTGCAAGDMGGALLVEVQ